MADINYVVGTNGDDVLDPTDGMNDYLGMGGNDMIDGTTGVNTIHFNSGDGVDTVKFALPRSYQFGDFLTAANNGLSELSGFGGGEYSNSYFASADSSLIGLLPVELQSTIGALQETFVSGVGYVPGSLDPATAQAAFTSLINWINTSTSNVIQFGPGITLANLNLQLGAMADLGAPQSTPVEFAVGVGNEQGIVFNLNGPPSVAGDSSSPPVIELTFQFADGTSATLADLMAAANQGVMGMQNGSENSESLRGSLSSDMIFGNGGNDLIDGGAGDDYLFGGNGDDVISSGSGYDNTYGEDGDDILAAGNNGGFLSGGQGNDVYAFNRGDGNVTIDNGDADGAGMDTISFGKDVSAADVVASVDPSSGILTLAVAGTADQITITWFDNGNGLAARPDQVIDRVQFIDADGTAHVYDLASLVQAAFPNPGAADPSVSVPLVTADAAELAVDAAGGETAIRYATTDTLFSNSNQVPTGVAVADQTVLEDDPQFSWALPAGTFSDPEGATLALHATTANGQALPSWLHFDAVHGTFSGTPTNDDVGSVAVTVTAIDPGGLSASQTFNLEVQNVNDAPTATAGVAHVAFAEDQSLGYMLPGDTFHDVDAGDTRTYAATLENGAALPSWLQFDSTNMIFAGTPTNDDVGSLSVIVTATDRDGLSVSKSVSIDIANTNDAPTVSAGVAVAAATEDATFTYQLPAGTFADVDAGDVLSYGAKMADGSALPSWLQVDAVSGTLSGTPANGDVGSLSVVITATDQGHAHVSKTVSISVANTNDAPTASAGVAVATATEDASFTYALPAGTFAEVDAGDVLTYGAKMADGSALPSWLQVDAANGTLHGTPANGDVGSLSVVVTATDRANTSASKTLSISVANTNDAPTASAGVAMATATEDASFTYALPAGTFADVDAGDVLTYGAKMADGSALPSWLQVDAANGTLHGTPVNGDVGSLSVVVTATDRANASASKTLSISVANTNDAPTYELEIANQTATEDAAFNYVLPANVFSDVDLNDSMTLSATLASGGALPTWLSFNASNGTFSGTPANSDVGALSIRVTARDRAGATASDVFNLSVANTNDAPTTAHAVADQTAVAGTLYSMVVPTNTFQDVDAGDALTLSARLANGDALPSWLHFDAATRTLSGTAGTAGQWNIALVATDLAGSSVSDAFLLNVGAAPVTPPTSTGKIINGTSGNDKLYGGAGNDQINGGKGKDLLSGAAGDDTLFVSADAKWGSGSTRTNADTSEKVSISGKVRSYDVFDGGTGSDTLVGTSGADAILLEDSKSSAPQTGARIIGVEKIDAGAGDDVVDLTSKRYSYGDVEINGGSGNDVLWSSAGKDVVRGGSGNDSLDGGAGNDYLEGGSGDDKVNGGSGVDVLQGGSGKDTLKDTSGNGVLDGGSNNDSLTEGSGNSMLIGGQGSDHLYLGGGYDVIAFNRGDGRDVVSSGKGGHATLSLGGGISYQDLTLSRSGSDLILNIGSSDRITFEKWYDGRKYQAVSKLQVVAEAMPGFDQGGDALHNDKIETFDFKGLVKAFDTARSHSPGLSKWTLTNAMAQFHLGGSDSAALGGDLAYQYGMNGTLASIALNSAQGTAGASQFGKQAQTLHSQTELQDGLVKLS